MKEISNIEVECVALHPRMICTGIISQVKERIGDKIAGIQNGIRCYRQESEPGYDYAQINLRPFPD